MTGVEFATVPAESFDSADTATSTARGALRWARLADEVVVWSESADPVRRFAGAESLSGHAAGLSLVTQVGKSFQYAHPDVPVLVDHGRHLVVDGGDVPAPTAAERGCWRVEALAADAVVVDRPRAGARETDPTMGDLLGLLSRSSYEGHLARITGPHTRHSTSGGFLAAAESVSADLKSFGYTVSEQSVSVGAGVSRNIVADLAGSNRGSVVVTAHLDSINHEDGVAAPAPGADDNASGAAGVLELGRVLATRSWHHDLRLILFGGEEQGLFGSTEHVAGLSAGERDRIVAVINMDMVGRRNTSDPGVLIEGAPLSRALIDDLVAAAATWTRLVVSTSLSPFASDHVPFIDADIPAVLTIEDNDTANRDVHSARDLVSTLDPALAMEILRMNLAALAGRLDGIPREVG
ncbi:M28 family metallopeptidase [Rhodococcus maanshanensis]|uniref:Peptidase family M28 n=1 Tax=Rhodococcus maanshanensis TaxID=183556 RepID=A0A1H7QW45_9NOCA|nr:M28 family metallopeptidase [Rhodococcus maanshanensis]SEL51845.1 Peptidase family M28 [Rhodococcus maanshanensis]